MSGETCGDLQDFSPASNFTTTGTNQNYPGLALLWGKNFVLV
jgi:hypothetical protein